MEKKELYNFVKFVADSGKVAEMQFKITGNSMIPTLYPGDTVIVKLGNPRDSIKEGDIILYKKYNDHFTVHRIREIIEENNSRKYATKGDNNKKNDSYRVSENEIVGVITGIRQARE